MSEAELVSTSRELQKEYPFNPINYAQERVDPFKQLFRTNTVVGMTDDQLDRLVLEANVKNKYGKLKAATKFLQVSVLMKSGAELYHTTSNATAYIPVIPQENMASTDEMITEAASDLRDKIEIENEITKLLSRGADIEFEQGMENDFTRALERMVLNYNVLAIEMLSDALKHRNIGESLISEMIQFLGIITDEETNFKRRLLLIDLLKSSSSIIRYGAIIGLESLNDPEALPDIRAAAKNEKFPPLHTEMLEIADILGKQ